MLSVRNQGICPIMEEKPLRTECIPELRYRKKIIIIKKDEQKKNSSAEYRRWHDLQKIELVKRIKLVKRYIRRMKRVMKHRDRKLRRERQLELMRKSHGDFDILLDKKFMSFENFVKY